MEPQAEKIDMLEEIDADANERPRAGTGEEPQAKVPADHPADESDEQVTRHEQNRPLDFGSRRKIGQKHRVGEILGDGILCRNGHATDNVQPERAENEPARVSEIAPERFPERIRFLLKPEGVRRLVHWV